MKILTKFILKNQSTIIPIKDRHLLIARILPKQHSMWAPVGPQLGKVGPQMGPGWARLGPNLGMLLVYSACIKLDPIFKG